MYIYICHFGSIIFLLEGPAGLLVERDASDELMRAALAAALCAAAAGAVDAEAAEGEWTNHNYTLTTNRNSKHHTQDM